MFVSVDLSASPPDVRLDEPEDCGRFHVEVSGGGSSSAGGPAGAAATAALAELGTALIEAGVGRVEDGDAFIEVIAVRSMAEGRVGPGWLEDFNVMLTYAKTKGWLVEQDREIRAHIEWR